MLIGTSFAPNFGPGADVMTIKKPDISHSKRSQERELAELVVNSMATPAAYNIKVLDVAHHETHISHVFLAGQFAYKIKKPIKTDFLDFTTLEKRKHYCDEEFRLDQRYAKDLYIGVVPITMEDGRVCVEGCGKPIDYAVKLSRFPDDALLSRRLEKGLVSESEVGELAETIASFHATARHCDQYQALRVPALVSTNLQEIAGGLRKDSPHQIDVMLVELYRWSKSYFSKHEQEFISRSQNGYVRECHGDLHTENIVYWNGKLVPFDGIEFNDAFRWIDVVNDAAFLTMDLAARGRLDLSRLFINHYLESTGDRGSLLVFRWYLVYRSLIRAMVAKMKADQHQNSPDLYQGAIQDCHDYIRLAYQFTQAPPPTLYITHGLSGSGKTMASEVLVARRGAIRLRSDIERKRLFGLSVNQSLDESMRHKIYCEAANIATYDRLQRLACEILQAGYPVVIDAAFLRQSDREHFRQLAKRENTPFAILDCNADVQTLRQRITDRIAKGNDASDANLHVLDLQLASNEPLSPLELHSVLTIEDIDK